MKRNTVLRKRSIGCLVSDVASGSEEKTTASVFGMYMGEVRQVDCFL